MSPDMDTLLLELHLSSYRNLFQKPDSVVQPDPDAIVCVATWETDKLVGWKSSVFAHGIWYGSGIDVHTGLFTKEEADGLAQRKQVALQALVHTHDWSNAPYVTNADFDAACDQLDHLVEKNK